MKYFFHIIRRRGSQILYDLFFSKKVSIGSFNIFKTFTVLRLHIRIQSDV